MLYCHVYLGTVKFFIQCTMQRVAKYLALAKLQKYSLIKDHLCSHILEPGSWGFYTLDDLDREGKLLPSFL